MPRAVLNPAATQAVPATAAAAPVQPAPKPVVTDSAPKADPYAALAAQLRSLGLTEEGIAQAVAQKRAADQKGKPVKAADPIEDPEVLDPEPAKPETPVAPPAPKSEADVNRQMVADLTVANKTKRAKAVVEPPAPAPVPATAAPAPAPAPAPVAAPAPAPAESDFASQMADAEDEDPILGVVAPHSTEEHHEQTSLVPAASQETAVAVQNKWTAASDGAISGEVDQSDFQMPQLKIVQGNGEATANHNQGELIFCDEKIFDGPVQDKPSPIMRFIPISLSKYWREEPPKRKNGEPMPKVQPRNVLTKAEVARLGGTTEWTVGRNGERVKPTWSPAARILLLIEQPENNEHPGFTIPIEDANGNVRYWAAAVYFVNGGAYRSFAKPIIDATTFILRDGDKINLSKRIWKMQTVKEKSGDFMVFNPRVGILNVLTPDSLRQMAANLVGSGNQPNQ